MCGQVGGTRQHIDSAEWSSRVRSEGTTRDRTSPRGTRGQLAVIGAKNGRIVSSLVSARVRPLLFIIGLILAAWVLRAVGSDAQAGAPQEWVTPQEVLVLFNARWPDEDGNHGRIPRTSLSTMRPGAASRGSACWAWP